jgi:hypothetical protein
MRRYKRLGLIVFNAFPLRDTQGLIHLIDSESSSKFHAPVLKTTYKRFSQLGQKRIEDIIGQEIFLDTVRLVQDTLWDPEKRALHHGEISYFINPHRRLSFQHVNDIIRIFMDVLRYLCPHGQVHQEACEVHILVSVGQEIAHFRFFQLRMGLPLDLIRLNDFALLHMLTSFMDRYGSVLRYFSIDISNWRVKEKLGRILEGHRTMVSQAGYSLITKCKNIELNFCMV